MPSARGRKVGVNEPPPAKAPKQTAFRRVNWRKSRPRASARRKTPFFEAVNPFDSGRAYLGVDGLPAVRPHRKGFVFPSGAPAPRREVQRMQKSLCRFLAEESGATSIEYATIGAFVSILIYAATKLIGTKLSSAYLLPVVGNLT
jgi:pilus assembly protein Flp/PilA